MLRALSPGPTVTSINGETGPISLSSTGGTVLITTPTSSTINLETNSNSEVISLNGLVGALTLANANGVSWSAVGTTITPSLGNITPTSVVASGNVSGATLSGTNVGSATLADASTQPLILSGGATPTAGNLVGLAIEKSGYEELFLGINKNSTTGEYGANSLYLSTYTATGLWGIGRGNGAGLIDKADIANDSSGNIVMPRNLTSNTITTTQNSGTVAALGTVGSSSFVTNPAAIDLGSTASSVAGQNLKLKLYHSSAGTIYGIGASNNSLDYVVTASGVHNYYVGTTSQFSVSSSNISAKSLNAGGMIKSAVTTGALSVAAAGTDYVAPNVSTTGQYASAYHALTDGTTIPIDFNNGNYQGVTIAGNRTITFSNPIAGARYLIQITQDATGSRLITWPTVKWQGGTAPVLSTTAGYTDEIALSYDGTNYYGMASTGFH